MYAQCWCSVAAVRAACGFWLWKLEMGLQDPVSERQIQHSDEEWEQLRSHHADVTLTWHRVDTNHLYSSTWCKDHAERVLVRFWCFWWWPLGRAGDCIYLQTISFTQQQLTMMISTVTDCSRAVHSFAAPAASKPSARGRSGSLLRFGAPRFNEDFIQVHRCDNEHGVTHDLSLYYRVYNPSHIHSQEAPPLIVLHGGP